MRKAPSRSAFAPALAVLAALGPALGCGKAEPPAAAMMAEAAPAAPAAKAAAADALPATPGAAPVARASRALRITGQASVVVDDVGAAVDALRQKCKDAEGFVSDVAVQGDGGARSATVVVRIPSSRVDAFRADFSSLGRITSLSEKVEDVTEQRADLAARLRNARAQEARLVQLMAEKTGSLADVLAVEKELAAVRETVERLEAQERTLEGQIAYATYTVQLSAPFATLPAPPPPSTGERLGRAAKRGLRDAEEFVIGSADFALRAGPTLLILGAFGLGGFRLSRALWRRRRKKAAASQAWAPPPYHQHPPPVVRGADLPAEPAAAPPPASPAEPDEPAEPAEPPPGAA